MDFSTVTLADLKRLVPLIEERDAIVARLAQIDGALGSLPGAPQVTAKAVSKPAVKAPKKAAAPAASKAKPSTGKSGALKDAVIQVLKQAPVGGVSVETIAETLNRKPAAIHVWFYTTGKGIKEIKKTGRGTYSWTGSES